MRLIIMMMGLGLAACTSAPITTDPAGDFPSEAPPAPAGGAVLPPDPVLVEAAAAQVDAALAVEDEGDVWERIRDGLELNRHMELRNVQDKLAWYRRNQEYLDRVADRARPYLYHIVEELERRKMPLDLALLPIVESAFHPFAHSPSRASGIWQFIPGTGKRYGLKQNWWYDGRRDIMAATTAALDYLENLRDEFNGDWLLALAAYNTGELNVARAVKRNRAAGKPTDFFSLQLPRETRGYVPSLLAVAELIAAPDRHGISWRPIPERPYFEAVTLDGQIDLATAAELAGISMDELYTLNPGFNQWATDPSGPHRLLVPVPSAARFRTGLAALPPDQRMASTQHVVRDSETLAGIALHYHSSVDAVKQANGLRANTIRAGQSLLIPGAKKPAAYYTLSAASRGVRLVQPMEGGHEYIVRRGDTLWDIGRRHGVSVGDLAAWNGLSGKAILRPGQKLQLRLAPGVSKAEGKAIAVEMPATTSEAVRYTVRRGDSLWLISQRFGVSIVQLQTWNKLSRGSLLRPGQVLIVFRPDQLAQGA